MCVLHHNKLCVIGRRVVTNFNKVAWSGEKGGGEQFQGLLRQRCWQVQAEGKTKKNLNCTEKNWQKKKNKKIGIL
jgi:hypothetical protein